jgi:methionine-rich copper-binding protein CopC
MELAIGLQLSNNLKKIKKMKKVQISIVLAVTALVFVSCKNEDQENAEKKLESYAQYVDSVSNVAEEKASENWEAIELKFNQIKMETDLALTTATDKDKNQTKLDESTAKYENFKMKIVTQKEQMNNDTKMVRYQTLFGPSYVNDDMKFNWVNKDNILSVYDNFVNTVQKNKDSYSREDWDEIKLVYEALDTRKNTVEKEGLTGKDNRKIAGLKIKFAPMYTLNRMGAKSEENAEAKK